MPILVMAHSRPNNLNTLLSDLEKLSPRQIHVSIDGTDSVSASENLVYQQACQWQEVSRHRITVEIQPINLGLLGHFKLALEKFFSRYEYGLILEDDIEFKTEFIDFLDQNARDLLRDTYWSICGHNPSPSLLEGEINQPICFFETRVHTIWGWCSSRESVQKFLEFLNVGNLEEKSLAAIRYGAERFTSNPLLRVQFKSVWKFKLARNLNSARPNWDNYWVLASWFYDRLSLMSSQTMSWEGRDQSKNQTHPHSKTFAFPVSKTPSF
jgi:hypothetical protein